jgi:hypothetical protein
MDKEKIKGVITCVAIIIMSVFLVPLHSMAADKNWIGGTGRWNNGNKWAPIGQPQDGDKVYLNKTDGTDNTVYYSNTLYPSAVLNSLEIDVTGTGTITLSQSGDPLAAADEYIGHSGTGTFTQTGGTNTLQGVAGSGTLFLGYNSGSIGTYNLSGTGNLSAFRELIGLSGKGTFTQTGGTNTAANFLYLGGNSGSSGTYNLGGTGNLLTYLDEIIGLSGKGTFNQTGGTNTLTYDLYLGHNSGSIGTYNLGGIGNLLSTYGHEYIGYKGTGTFNQTGGTHTLKGMGGNRNLYLGYNSGSSGTYNLSGTGNLSPNFNEYIGYSGTGTFNQTGGTNTVKGALDLGLIPGSSGTYNLSGDGNLSANWINVGSGGTGTFTQTGGTNTAANVLDLGSGSTGTYQLSGTGTLSAGLIIVGSGRTGTFTQTGGTCIAGIYLGSNSGIGTYELSGTGTLFSAGDEYIGQSGTGIFKQTGGTNNITRNLIIAYKEYNPGSIGTYFMEGGTLNTGKIINRGNFNYTGGIINASLMENYGIFKGSGNSFIGNVINYGVVSPGLSPGSLSITGDYTQGLDGLLEIELAGYIQATEYDFLKITGIATLAGELDVNLLNNFDPITGSIFDILHADLGVTGTFTSLDLPTLSGGRYWDIVYELNDVKLYVEGGAAPAPEPATMLLLGSGLIGLAGYGRKKFFKK